MIILSISSTITELFYMHLVCCKLMHVNALTKCYFCADKGSAHVRVLCMLAVCFIYSADKQKA